MTAPAQTGPTGKLRDLRANGVLLLVCLIWGITWPLMRIALNGMPPLTMRTVTSAAGALTMLAICAALARSLRLPGRKAWAHVAVIAVLNVAGFSLMSAFAQISAATSRVAILTYTMPIWTVLLAWVFLGEKPNARQTLALALCAVGLAILVFPLATAGVPVGLLLAIASGFSWGAGTVYIKWARLGSTPWLWPPGSSSSPSS